MRSSLSRITTELTILGLTPRHKRLTTWNDKLGFDQPGLWQGLRRLAWGEGRERLCDYLDNLVDDISLLHQDIVGEEAFTSLLRTAVMGVDNQIELYGKDVQTAGRLLTIRGLLAKQVQRAGGAPVPLPDYLMAFLPVTRGMPISANANRTAGSVYNHQHNNTPEHGHHSSPQEVEDGYGGGNLVSAVSSKLADAADSAMGYFRNLHVPLNLRPSPTAFEEEIESASPPLKTTRMTTQTAVKVLAPSLPKTSYSTQPTSPGGNSLTFPVGVGLANEDDRPFPGLMDNPAFFASGSSDDEGTD